MKIELVQGCIADNFEIDGAKVYDMSVDELKEALVKVSEYIVNLHQPNNYNLNTALYQLVELFAPYEVSEEACECCGDFIYSYTLDL